MDRAAGISSAAAHGAISVGAPPAQARRRLALSLISLVVLAALALYGGIFDRSIRPDPFSASPGFFDWLLNNQPHPALKQMPVVPVGWRGTLTIRPQDTRWINTPWLPGIGSPRRSTAAVLPLVSPARAGAPEQAQQLKNPVVQQKANPPANQPMPSAAEPVQRQQTQTPFSTTAEPLAYEEPALVPPRPPESPPRLLTAYSSADGRQIWIGGDDSRILSSSNGGATWTEVQTGIDAGSIFSLGMSNGAVQALTSQRWTLTTTNDGGSWTGEPTISEAEGFYFGDESQPSLWFYSVGDPASPQKSPLFLPALADGRALGAGLLFLPKTMAARRSSGVFDASYAATGGGVIETFPVAATTTWEEAVDQTLAAARDRADLVGINAFARQPPADAGTIRVWLAGDAGALALVTLPIDPAAPARVDNPGTPTRAALRSLYLQPDGKIGWASSGWFDGNEEDDRPVVLQTTDSGASWQRLPYRHMPPPWLLYLVLPGLVAAAYGSATGFLDLRKAARPRASVADEASSDRPISWADKDALGLQPIARALSKFLRNRNTDPPVTFAITGPWGSGKSSLMNLLAEDLRCFDTRPVWFNAWHHQKEDHLLAALLENIRSQAPPPWWRWTGIAFRARLFWIRSGRLLWRLALIALIAAAALTTLYLIIGADTIEHVRAESGEVKLQDLATKPIEDIIGGLLGGLTALGSIGVVLYSLAMLLMKLQVISLNPAKLMSTLSRAAGSSALRDQLSFRHRFASEFGEVCRALRLGGSAGMVIMIDDLDRCRAENVLEILEAVNFLTTAGRCFVILAIDEEKVISAVAYGFKESILTLPKPGEAVAADDDLKPDARELATFARNYLEKLINISVPVPSATAEATVVLLNALDGDATPVSAWPRRARRCLHDALDIAAALALFVGIAGAVLLGVKALAPQQATPPTSSAVVAAGTDRVAPRASRNSEAGPAPIESGGEAIAVVDAAALEASGLWLHEAPLALSLLLVVVFASGRMVALREDRVEDSIDFRDALRIWSPVIFAAHPTPRGLKRYQNRLRYLAMRARGDEQGNDWIDRLFRQSQDRPSGVTAVLPEPTLVGLGALAAFKPDLLDEPAYAFDEHIDAARSPAAKSMANLGMAEEGSVRPLVDVRDILAVVRDDFRRNFPDLWPPTEDQINAFRAISGTTKG